MTGLLILALALAADAFALSLVRGAGDASAAMGKQGGLPRALRALETGLAFGLAQALMPLGGWALGKAALARLAAFDHWIAGGVLAAIGLGMLREAIRPAPAAGPAAGLADRLAGGPGHYSGLLLAAIATSLDAAAAGLSLDLFGIALGMACLLIGLVTFGLCWCGYLLAARLGAGLGARARIPAGLALIGLGLLMALEIGG